MIMYAKMQGNSMRNILKRKEHGQKSERKNEEEVPT